MHGIDWEGPAVVGDNDDEDNTAVQVDDLPPFLSDDQKIYLKTLIPPLTLSQTSG